MGATCSRALPVVAPPNIATLSTAEQPVSNEAPKSVSAPHEAGNRKQDNSAGSGAANEAKSAASVEPSIYKVDTLASPIPAAPSAASNAAPAEAGINEAASSNEAPKVSAPPPEAGISKVGDGVDATNGASGPTDGSAWETRVLRGDMDSMLESRGVKGLRVKPAVAVATARPKAASTTEEPVTSRVAAAVTGPVVQPAATAAAAIEIVNTDSDSDIEEDGGAADGVGDWLADGHSPAPSRPNAARIRIARRERRQTDEDSDEDAPAAAANAAKAGGDDLHDFLDDSYSDGGKGGGGKSAGSALSNPKGKGSSSSSPDRAPLSSPGSAAQGGKGDPSPQRDNRRSPVAPGSGAAKQTDADAFEAENFGAVDKEWETMKTLKVVLDLAGLDPAHQQRFLAALQEKTYPRGANIVRQGASAEDGFYILTAGEVVVTRNLALHEVAATPPSLVVTGPDGPEMIITHLYEGHSFGETALVQDSTRNANVRAIGEVVCRVMTKASFKPFLEEDPRFRKMIGELVMKTEETARKRTEMLREQGGTVITPEEQREEIKVTKLSKKGKTAAGRTVINGYVLEKKLGQGTQGTVYLAMSLAHSKKYAIKVVSRAMLKRKRIGAKTDEDVLREVAVMKRLAHPNVVALFEVIDDPTSNKIYMVQEYMELGQVMTEYEYNSPLEEGLARKYFREMLCGMEYLHFQGIVHRDIKPANVLISGDGTAKLADFGTAILTPKDSDQLTDVQGSPAFQAPELFFLSAGQSYAGFAVDVYALGATLHCFIVGTPPFMADSELALVEKVKHEDFRLAKAVHALPHLRNLLLRCLTKDPARRIKMSEVMTHDWVTEEGSKPLVTRPYVNLKLMETVNVAVPDGRRGSVGSSLRAPDATGVLDSATGVSSPSQAQQLSAGGSSAAAMRRAMSTGDSSPYEPSAAAAAAAHAKAQVSQTDEVLQTMAAAASNGEDGAAARLRVRAAKPPSYALHIGGGSVDSDDFSEIAPVGGPATLPFLVPSSIAAAAPLLHPSFVNAISSPAAIDSASSSPTAAAGDPSSVTPASVAAASARASRPPLSPPLSVAPPAPASVASSAAASSTSSGRGVAAAAGADGGASGGGGPRMTHAASRQAAREQLQSRMGRGGGTGGAAVGDADSAPSVASGAATTVGGLGGGGGGVSRTVSFYRQASLAQTNAAPDSAAEAVSDAQKSHMRALRLRQHAMLAGHTGIGARERDILADQKRIVLHPNRASATVEEFHMDASGAFVDAPQPSSLQTPHNATEWNGLRSAGSSADLLAAGSSMGSEHRSGSNADADEEEEAVHGGGGGAQRAWGRRRSSGGSTASRVDDSRRLRHSQSDAAAGPSVHSGAPDSPGGQHELVPSEASSGASSFKKQPLGLGLGARKPSEFSLAATTASSGNNLRGDYYAESDSSSRDLRSNSRSRSAQLAAAAAAPGQRPVLSSPDSESRLGGGLQRVENFLMVTADVENQAGGGAVMRKVIFRAKGKDGLSITGGRASGVGASPAAGSHAKKKSSRSLLKVESESDYSEASSSSSDESSPVAKSRKVGGSKSAAHRALLGRRAAALDGAAGSASPAAAGVAVTAPGAAMSAILEVDVEEDRTRASNASHTELVGASTGGGGGAVVTVVGLGDSFMQPVGSFADAPGRAPRGLQRGSAQATAMKKRGGGGGRGAVSEASDSDSGSSSSSSDSDSDDSDDFAGLETLDDMTGTVLAAGLGDLLGELTADKDKVDDAPDIMPLLPVEESGWVRRRRTGLGLSFAGGAPVTAERVAADQERLIESAEAGGSDDSTLLPGDLEDLTSDEAAAAKAGGEPLVAAPQVSRATLWEATNVHGRAVSCPVGMSAPIGLLYGTAASRGRRAVMEDRVVAVSSLNALAARLAAAGVGPAAGLTGRRAAAAPAAGSGAGLSTEGPQYAFFAVYDGHNGIATAETLSQVLHIRLANALNLAAASSGIASSSGGIPFGGASIREADAVVRVVADAAAALPPPEETTTVVTIVRDAAPAPALAVITVPAAPGTAKAAAAAAAGATPRSARGGASLLPGQIDEGPTSPPTPVVLRVRASQAGKVAAVPSWDDGDTGGGRSATPASLTSPTPGPLVLSPSTRDATPGNRRRSTHMTGAGLILASANAANNAAVSAAAANSLAAAAAAAAPAAAATHAAVVPLLPTPLSDEAFEFGVLVDTCLDLDSDILDAVMPGEPISGSTGVMLLVKATAGAGRTLFCANVGDSRAVLCRAGLKVDLSFDHKLTRADERARILAAGGRIIKDRLHGILAVSRAFGDAEHKMGLGSECWGTEFSADPLSAEPEVTHEPLGTDDEFAILACDGVWDVLTSQQAVNFVRRRLLHHGDVGRAARQLVAKAVSLGSIDNVSAVVVAFT